MSSDIKPPKDYSEFWREFEELFRMCVRIQIPFHEIRWRKKKYAKLVELPPEAVRNGEVISFVIPDGTGAFIVKNATVYTDGKTKH